MPTHRLTTYDKDNLVTKFANIIHKCTNTHHFPIKKSEISDWARSLTPQSLLTSFDVFMDYCREKGISPPLVRTAYSTLSCTVDTDDATYGVEVSIWEVEQKILLLDLVVKEGDMFYDELANWAEERRKTQHKIKDAIHYIEQLVHSCTSAGQIKLLLPDEVDKFIPPSLLSSLQYAERKSRTPRHWEENKEREQVFMEMLALGSMSPDENKRDKSYPDAEVGTIYWKTKPKGK